MKKASITERLWKHTGYLHGAVPVWNVLQSVRYELEVISDPHQIRELTTPVGYTLAQPSYYFLAHLCLMEK
ncbi:hypothetical protein J6590_050077 [Homalodisca vitripennis]|nr:hypothetical protein J6590_050077 [Homalodisca vitripennis]